jgi:hypothetical protein
MPFAALLDAKGAQAVSTPRRAASHCQSSPRQFPDWLTGRQRTCTTRHPSQQRVSTLGGSQALSTPRWR